MLSYNQQNTSVLQKPASIILKYHQCEFIANALEFLYSMEDNPGAVFPYDEYREAATVIRDAMVNICLSLEAAHLSSKEDV